MHPIRFLLRHLWAATALTVVVLAVASFTLRFVLLPQAGYLLPGVERMVSDYAGRPVRIAGFSIDWLGRQPVLSLQELRVYPPDSAAGEGDAPQLQLASLFVSVDPWALLTGDGLRIGQLSLAGIRLALRRRPDGQIGIDGFSPAAAARPSEENRDAARWLFTQPRLGLYSSQLELLDEASGRTLRLRDVNVEYQNHEGRRRLSGALRLPTELGRQLQFIARFQGDLWDSRQWRGELYLKGRALRLGAEPQGLLPARLGIARGEADLELWSHWDRGRVTAATADLEARGVESHGVLLDTLGGLLSARRDGQGWRVDGERLHLSHAGRHWESDYLALELAGGGGRFAAQRLDLEPLGGLLLASGLLDRERREMLESLHPGGRLEGLELAWDDAGGFAVRGELADWSNRPWRQLPGIDGLGARFEGNRRSGRIEFDQGSSLSRIAVELPKLFRHPLIVDHLDGTLQWREEPEGWRLTAPRLHATNAHLTTLSRLDALIPGDGTPPTLDLQSDFHDGDGSQTFRYLPVGVMPPETVSWLDRAIVGGRVTAGSMLFHGNTGDFPFKGGEGRFEVRFNLENGILDYQQGWPRLEELEAEIAFINQGLHAEGRGGRILGGELRRISADIPDLNHAMLTIDGEADAPAEDLLAVLRETPLRKEIGVYFQGVEARGNPALNLRIEIPLIPQGGPIEVDGQVAFREGEVSLADSDLTLERIVGEVGFNNDGIRAKGLQARFRGEPVTIDANPLERGGSRVSALGRFSARELLAPYSPFSASRMEGTTDWRVEIDLPGRARSRDGMQVRTRLTSDLKGVAIQLPQPLAKAPEESSPLELTAAFGKGAESHPIRFRCGDRIRGEILPGGPRAPRRAAVALGGGPLPELPASGLAVGGEVEEMALAPWIALWTEPAEERSGEAPEVRRLDLRVAQLEAFGHLFREQRLSGGPEGEEWRFRLTGPDAEGVLRLPRAWDRGRTLSAELSHLILRPHGRRDDQPPSPPIDPRDWPEIQLGSDAFTYDGLEFGRLEMNAVPAYDGLELHRIALDSSHTHLEGRGDWSWHDGRPESWIALRIDSQDLQRTLTTFGYPRTIAGGSGTANLNLNWPGGPTGFALGTIEGEMMMDLNDLRILELDPGIGRVLGLLRLDFANLLGEGIGFDSVRGRALLAGGIADITELELAGAAADLAVAGNLDLLNERYDLLVDLTPHLSSSLPLAGAIAAANPVVGAAIFLADRLMEGEIDKVAKRHYTVTGEWDDPRLEKLSREARGDAEKALRHRLGRP